MLVVERWRLFLFNAARVSEPNDQQQQTAEETGRRFSISAFLNVLGPFLILLFVMGLFAVVMPGDVRGTFFGIYNFKIILSQTVIVGIGALGMTMIIVSGGIDLSVGSVIALTSVLAAYLMQQKHGLVVAYAAALGFGALVGVVNGSIIAGFRMTPFIVTLGMLGIGRGLAKWRAENQTVNPPAEVLPVIEKLMAIPHPDQPSSLAISPGIGILVLLAVVMTIVMRNTIFGRYIFAIGSNEATARLCGIRTRLMKVSIYTFAGVFFGLAGIMQFSRLRQGDPTTAIGLELDIIAAVVIGGASLNGGTGSILGSMIGALTMSVLRSGSQQSDWPNYMQEIIIGIVIILAVGLDKWRQSRMKV
jgi:ribose transport system permease protein